MAIHIKKVEILCPDCGKLITIVSADSVVTIFGWCRRCRKEKVITYGVKKQEVKRCGGNF